MYQPIHQDKCQEVLQAFAEGAPLSPLVPEVLEHQFCPHPALESMTSIPFSVYIGFLYIYALPSLSIWTVF